MRLNANQRREIIVKAGVDLANLGGLHMATHDGIAATCEPQTSTATVRWYFRRKNDLWAAIARHDEASRTVRIQAKALGVI